VDLSDFDYSLPKELIAQEPLPERGASRLMVLDGQKILHRGFSDLPDHLGNGDVLILNDSRVIPARILGRRETGGRVELLILNADGEKAEALVRSKPLKTGETIVIPQGKCFVERRIGGSRYALGFAVDGGIRGYLDSFGEMPTPPYIKKKLEKQDRYQTVFACKPGSVAAPTAGLHFTPSMLSRLNEMGVTVAFITLHIGPATFQPVRANEVDGHRMEPEYFQVPEETARAVNGRRGRLVAVGTTVVKTIESAMKRGSGQHLEDIRSSSPRCLRPLGAAGSRGMAPGKLEPTEGWSELFIYPGHLFRLRPDMMLTNFHLPRSTLIMLVSALVGRERLLAAYREAVKERYRFYSFGDSMLCLN
jgi:S-adenosylmethionine:tRNA ribosyltransferase-isomerase